MDIGIIFNSNRDGISVLTSLIDKAKDIKNVTTINNEYCVELKNGNRLRTITIKTALEKLNQRVEQFDNLLIEKNSDEKKITETYLKDNGVVFFLEKKENKLNVVECKKKKYK